MKDSRQSTQSATKATRGELIALVEALRLRVSDLESTLRSDDVARELDDRLRALTLRHDTLLAAMPEIVMEVDNDKVYTWANQAGEEFFGEDVVGKAAADFFEGEQDTYATVQPLFEGSDDTLYVESWQRRKDGEKRLLAWSCRTFKDVDGNVTGALSSAHDITDREQAKQVLALQARIAAVFATVLDDEMFNEVLAIVLEVMESPFGVFGYLDENGDWLVPTMTRQVWDQCRVPEKTIRFPRATWGDSTWPRALREKRTIYSNEPSANVPEGHVGIRRHISLPILNQGEAIGLFQVANKPADYTEADLRTLQVIADHVAPLLDARLKRERAQEALRESESRFRQLANSLPQLVWTCEPDGRCDFLSEQWVAYTGVPEAPQLGFGWLERLHADDRAPTVAAWEAAVAAGTDFHVEFRIRRHDGEYRWFDTRAVRLRDAHGNTVKWFGSNADITERKQVEEALKHLNVVLEQRVADRTAQLEAANKELEAFAYSVSHDLRAPLRHISGFANILAEDAGDALDEEGRDCLQTITDSVREMGVLIDDLLEFSRAGRAELQISDVDMEHVVAEALVPIRRETAGRAIEWSIGPLTHVIGDHALLRQVWANLLDNAVKFSGSRKPARIAVGALDDREDERRAVFFVRDNGVGFDMRYADKLFGVFQRLHGVADFEGTGVGLANVQRIVTRLGGRVWAEAEPDNGATFFFSLPRPKES